MSLDKGRNEAGNLCTATERPIRTDLRYITLLQQSVTVCSFNPLYHLYWCVSKHGSHRLLPEPIMAHAIAPRYCMSAYNVQLAQWLLS